METIIEKEDLENLFVPAVDSEVKVVLEDGSESDFKSIKFKYGEIQRPDIEDKGKVGGMFG